MDPNGEKDGENKSCSGSLYVCKNLVCFEFKRKSQEFVIFS